MNWGLFGFLVGRMHCRRQEENGGIRREGPPEGKRSNLSGVVVLAGMGFIALLFWLFG